MPPIPLGDIEKHFWLTRSVARCIGVSLTDAIADGRLSEHGYAEMVTRCRAAQCDGRCELWLGSQHTQLQKAPEFCANAEVLNKLR